MLLRRFTIKKFLFIPTRIIDIILKEDKNGDYIGIEIVDEKFNFFKTTSKQECMYVQNNPLKIVSFETDMRHVELGVVKDFISVMIDSKRPNLKTDHFIDIYKYELNTCKIKCIRSKINIP